MKKIDNDNIKTENRKALKPFLLLILISGIVGGFMGYFSGILSDRVDLIIPVFLSEILIKIMPFSIGTISIIFIFPIYLFYSQGKKTYQKWDGENEELIDLAERKLGYALLLTSILLILCFFFFAASFHVNGVESLIPLIITLVSFLISIALIIVLQQKIVDQVKKINPEKKGSVYDMDFNKKWQNSCDEAQKLIIYKSAYAAYQTVSGVCIGLWVILFIANTFFDTGLLPIAVVAVIWLILVISYSLTAIKLEKNMNAEN